MKSDVILHKVGVIERCTKRIHEEFDNNPVNLTNYTKQDSIILNIQRACEASIDLAMHIVAERKLGLPQTSREGFDLLAKKSIISNALSEKLKAMVGFRNVAVHDYQNLNLNILQSIIEKHLVDFSEFSKVILSN